MQRSSLHILGINPLSDTGFANTFSHYTGCFFTANNNKKYCFSLHRLPIYCFLCRGCFVWYNPTVYFCFCGLCFYCHIKEIIAKTRNCQKIKKLFPYFLLLGVSQLQILRFYSFWADFCAWCKIKVWFPPFACRHPVFPTFVEEPILTPLCILGTLVS